MSRHANRTAARVPGAMPALVGVLVASVGLAWVAPAPAHATAPRIDVSSPGVSPAGVSRAATGSEVHALDLLERAARAEESTPYEGTQFVASWGRVTTSYLVEVENVPGRGTAARLLGVGPDHAPVEGFRSAAAPFGDVGHLRLLARNYDLAGAGVATVAGRPVDVVEVRADDRDGDEDRGQTPGDDLLVARVWVDSETGLVLRREAYDPTGRTVRASAFLDLRVGLPVRMSSVPPEIPGPSGQALDDEALASKRSQGWTCPDEPVDGLLLQEVRRLQRHDGEVMQMSYSDGLESVSVFEQRGRLDMAGLEGFRVVRVGQAPVHVRDGLPMQVVWVAEDTVFTVVADAPGTTVAAVVAALPRATTDEEGVLTRIERGLRRAQSWFRGNG